MVPVIRSCQKSYMDMARHLFTFNLHLQARGVNQLERPLSDNYMLLTGPLLLLSEVIECCSKSRGAPDRTQHRRKKGLAITFPSDH